MRDYRELEKQFCADAEAERERRVENEEVLLF